MRTAPRRAPAADQVLARQSHRDREWKEGTLSARILVADDEPNIVISLGYLLRREGHEVTVAYDGRQTLDAVARERPDLILLDVMMPLKNGFEVCQHLRATDAFHDIPIIMLTARGRDTDVAKGLALGANAYLTKPFSTQELMAKVAELLAARAS